MSNNPLVSQPGSISWFSSNSAIYFYLYVPNPNIYVMTYDCDRDHFYITAYPSGAKLTATEVNTP